MFRLNLEFALLAPSLRIFTQQTAKKTIQSKSHLKRQSKTVLYVWQEKVCFLLRLLLSCQRRTVSTSQMMFLPGWAHVQPAKSSRGTVARVGQVTSAQRSAALLLC